MTSSWEAMGTDVGFSLSGERWRSSLGILTSSSPLTTRSAPQQAVAESPGSKNGTELVRIAN